MQRGKFYFITGGARSGKSSFAERLAASLPGSVTYLATAEALDDEMRERIRKHRERRPVEWGTVEEPRLVAAVLERIGQQPGVILIDCLTMLVTNLMYGGLTGEVEQATEARVLAEMQHLAEVISNCQSDVILVSNEVGLGLVPVYPEGRLFRDLAGLANQIMATQADHVYFLASGLAIDLKVLQQPL